MCRRQGHGDFALSGEAVCCGHAASGMRVKQITEVVVHLSDRGEAVVVLHAGRGEITLHLGEPVAGYGNPALLAEAVH
ncbi:hypothetical protein D3C73_1519020 [compost metagenome]